MITRDMAGLIANDFLYTANPELWDGSGLMPGSFTTDIKTYTIDEDLDLDLSFEFEDGRWTHYMKLRERGSELLLDCLHGEGITDGGKIRDTILELCNGDQHIKPEEMINTFQETTEELISQMATRLSFSGLELKERHQTIDADGNLNVSAEIYARNGKLLDKEETGFQKDIGDMETALFEMEGRIKENFPVRWYDAEVKFTNRKDYRVGGVTKTMARIRLDEILEKELNDRPYGTTTEILDFALAEEN